MEAKFKRGDRIRRVMAWFQPTSEPHRTVGYETVVAKTPRGQDYIIGRDGKIHRHRYIAKVDSATISKAEG